MRQFFVPTSAIQGGRVLLTGALHHHAKNVLRMKSGDEVSLVDEEGRRFPGVMQKFGAGEVWVNLGPGTMEQRVFPELRLLVCLPKGRLIEDILDAATQAGVDEFVAAVSSRTLSRESPGESVKKTARWESIVREASQQSNRPFIPKVLAPRKLEEVADLVRGQACLWAWEKADHPVETALAGMDREVPWLNLIVGPEGGFAQEEIDLGRSWGCQMVGLGPRILRTPVACVALATLADSWRRTARSTS